MFDVVSGSSRHYFHVIKNSLIIRGKNSDIRSTRESSDEIRKHRGDRCKIAKLRRTREELADGLGLRKGGQCENNSESGFEERHVCQRKQSGYKGLDPIREPVGDFESFSAERVLSNRRETIGVEKGEGGKIYVNGVAARWRVNIRRVKHPRGYRRTYT